MADTQTCVWSGASGKTYTYYVHDINFDPKPDQDGNYIFAKIVDSKWSPVYIGEGDLKDRKEAHLNDGCVTEKGATHFHCHMNDDKEARRAEESDLLGNYPQAYKPTGCNEKPGG